MASPRPARRVGGKVRSTEKYLPELMADKDSMEPSFTHALRLVNQEMENFQKVESKDKENIDVVQKVARKYSFLTIS